MRGEEGLSGRQVGRGPPGSPCGRHGRPCSKSREAAEGWREGEGSRRAGRRLEDREEEDGCPVGRWTKGREAAIGIVVSKGREAAEGCLPGGPRSALDLLGCPRSTGLLGLVGCWLVRFWLLVGLSGLSVDEAFGERSGRRSGRSGRDREALERRRRRRPPQGTQNEQRASQPL